jgi:hypothetical protein
MASSLLEFPLRGLTFDVWPGPGDSEGGGWDR